MAEYIGARITLISKSDIRYSGVLHEISSENSTVALENVKSFGTEGRRQGEDEIPPSDNVYEYIVFRGSDVKDLKIEPAAKESKPQPPQMPDDPAILGAARPPTSSQAQQQQQNQGRHPQHQQQQNFGPGGQYPPQWGQYPPQPYGRGFGPQGGFGGPGGPGGPGGFGGYNGYPPMPFGPPPPGWAPPPGQGFPGQGPFSPGLGGPMGPPPQQGVPHQQQQGQQSKAPIAPPGLKDDKAKPAEVDGAPKPEAKPKSQSGTPAPVAAVKQAPAPPNDTKPDVAAALAEPKQNAPAETKAPPAAPKAAPTGPRGGRVIPAIPLASPAAKKASQASSQGQPGLTAQHKAPTAAQQQYQNATQAATAAVAAAMAKIPKPGQARGDPNSAALDNLAQKVADMRADDKIRHSRQPGTGGFVSVRGGRGGRGRGGQQNSAPKIEVPDTDFDFESSNAKFNKLDLVKEAIATGSPLGESPHETGPGAEAEVKDEDEVVIPAATTGTYNKSSSFFDNISSELKDREESKDKRMGGREFRSEERQKNLETFGQGSIDGYRGGYRGRGRGRGFRGRGGPRGRGRGFGRGDAAVAGAGAP